MQYVFLKDKDGHRAGDVIDLMPSDFLLNYWLKKQCIEPYHREQEIVLESREPEIATPEPKKLSRKRRK